MGPESNKPEVVCQSNEGGKITSGGGFSNFYPVQYWQMDAIEKWKLTTLNSSTKPFQSNSSYFNSSMRGYPDVSLLGHNYLIVTDFSNYGIDRFLLVNTSGTSASSPVFAGMVSLVNAARLAEGKSSLGWINPALYQLHNQFILKDIVSGNNKWTKTMECKEGFYAVEGWF